MSVVDKITQSNNDADICDLIDNAGEEDVIDLITILSSLLEHSSWIVRASAIDFVGRFKRKDFLPHIKKNLKYRVCNVRVYALEAYYELLKRKALPVLKRESKSPTVRIRATALALLFVETGEKAIFERIKRILTRKNCQQNHQFCVYNIFEYFLDTRKYPEILELYQSIISRSPNRAIVETLMLWADRNASRKAGGINKGSRNRF